MLLRGKGTAVSLEINHVSVNALDLKESVDFYVDLLGAEPIATPNFGLPVQWLALGGTQLHLFQAPLTPTSHHHLGITVDDVEPVYRAAEKRDAFDDEAFGSRLVELPGDIVQLYLRDPAGNLVEIDQKGADRLPEDMRARLKPLWGFREQSEEEMSARLYVR
jgi:catechol 2,3-dioxygenase-like lactoylglutathione lyase family enzyme